MMVAIEQVEALDVDARRRGGKILCRGASRIPNLALVRASACASMSSSSSVGSTAAAAVIPHTSTSISIQQYR